MVDSWHMEFMEWATAPNQATNRELPWWKPWHGCIWGVEPFLGAGAALCRLVKGRPNRALTFLTSLHLSSASLHRFVA